MTQQQQSIPEFENDNLLAKIFTSRRWQKKLSNQNMNYQWIPCDQSQIQSMLSQVQVNIPNAYVDSCESDYFTFNMKMKIPQSKIYQINQQNTFKYLIVQYKNALYLVTTNYQFTGVIPANKALDRFVEAIESGYMSSDKDVNKNTKDFGICLVEKKTSATSELEGDNKTLQYQKIMNLPYNSACFLDRSVLNHQNVDKSKSLQQINRLIYRQQYDPTITQEYMNQHWYIYYGNNKPQVIYSDTYNVNSDNKDIIFSYQIIIPMNKIFWLWQQDFLPLFKLKNPLNLQFVINTQMLKNLMNVKWNTTDSTSQNLNQVVAQPIAIIDYATIQYYNIGCYLLVCSDTIMQKKLLEELNDMQGIVLPQTQIWIESYKTSTGEDKQYQTNIGFNCMTNLELGLYLDTNQAYYRGYSTLKDICQEYYTSQNNLITYLNPQKDDFDWYTNKLSFYMPQITFNAKQTFIGQKFINSIPFYLTINNRGQQNGDQNPFNENMFDYFNKLNIRYEQFTDKYVQDVEANEMNYSGVAIQKQNNNYITLNLADYNVVDLSGNLTKFNSEIAIVGANNKQTNSYYVEILYKYKQILQIDQAGNLTQMLQEYML